MPPTHLSLDTLVGWLRGLPAAHELGWSADGRVLLVDLDDPRSQTAPEDLPDLHTGLAAVVVGITDHRAPLTHPCAVVCDVVLARDDPAVDAILATVDRTPTASVALAMLLRGAARRAVDDGLLAESAVYSALQSGPELARWRAANPPRARSPEGPPVQVDRSGDVLTITLDRPHVRNALDTAMRDALVDALALAAADPSIVEVHLRGAGAAFCAGGDLDEFGSFPDAANAHLVRLQQSVGRAIAVVAERVTAHLHGACVGSGIELPAFAGRVLAAPDTRISLPELSLGLVPGAGGTVSLPRRIGRWRTARLALTGEWVDAPTALEWGLVDAIEDPAAGGVTRTGTISPIS